MPAGEPTENEGQDLSTEELSRRAVLRRGLGFAIAAPAILTLLQACGDDDDEEDGGDGEEPTPEPAADETEPAAETPAPAAETPAAEGTPVDIDATTGAPPSDPLPDPPQTGP
jgi:hypothetical protein